MEKINLQKATSLNGNDVLKIEVGKNKYFGEEALQFITENENSFSEKEKEKAHQIFNECKTSFLLKNMVGRLKLDFKTVEFGGVGKDSYGKQTDSRVWIPCDPDFEPVKIQKYVAPHTWSDDKGYQAHQRYECYLIQLNGEMFIVKDSRYVTYNGTDYSTDIYKCPQIEA